MVGTGAPPSANRSRISPASRNACRKPGNGRWVTPISWLFPVPVGAVAVRSPSRYPGHLPQYRRIAGQVGVDHRGDGGRYRGVRQWQVLGVVDGHRVSL
jgi:hypothetical protein